MRDGRIRRKVIACLLALLIFGSMRVAGQDATGVPRPFSAGEKLLFRIEWNPPWFLFFLPVMEAGEVEVQLVRELQYQGRKAIEIRFKAHSSGTFVNLVGIKVDDESVYISDAATFCTMEATEKIREGQRKRDINVIYLQDSNRLHIREVDLGVIPNKIRKDEYKEGIPKCVKDVFSALLSIRLRDFSLGMVEKTQVGNADRVKEVQSVVEKKEVVSTPMGRYESWRLNTVALLGSLFREGGQFRIWLTADERRLPVQFEAKVRLGKVTGKLKTANLPAPPEIRSREEEKIRNP
ncbi:MAG TPA: DUF3108 domain-containing protein [Acidobacteriota bacterium]|nr:DUF3108 domain-containing protein [Acidobacteriota bacterium]